MSAPWETSEEKPAVEEPAAPSSAFTCRLYRPDDEASLMRLLEHGFEGWPAVETSVAPIEHLRWKLGIDREPATVHAVVARDSAILGASLSFAQRYRIGKRVISGRQGTDLVVDPDYRGQGLGRIFLNFSSQEYLRHYEFELHVGSRSRHPAMSTVRSHVYESSQEFAYDVNVLEVPLSLSAALQPAKRGSFSPARRASFIAAYGVGLLAKSRTPKAQASYTISDASSFDERVNEFWEQASAPFDFAVVRDKEYLNWRYADRRAGTFTIRIAAGEGRLLGYSVLRMLGQTGNVADLLALPGQTDVVASLLHDALVRFRSAGATSARCWAPHGHPYVPLLRRVGFLHEREARHLTYRTSAAVDAVPVLRQPGLAVHLMIGDSDLV